MNFTNDADEKFMRRAIELARRGAGRTAPNPMVGAVVVRDGRIAGKGWHKRCGGLHAEREAFAAMKEPAAGATLYVTLEPCCHHGKTPPCTDAIIENGISRVVVGSRDPNPLVSGGGVRILREHGIEVVEDFLREECDELNPEFFHYITTGLPYVVLKFAMTLDGKIASRTGASKWITGEEARAHVHSLRGHYSAILAGIGTVLADDPMLNCRIEGAHQPLRVIADSNLRIPLESNIVKTAKEYPTLIAAAVENPEKQKALEAAGAEVIYLPTDTDNISSGNFCEEKTSSTYIEKNSLKFNRVDPGALIRELGRRGCSGVLVEGGSEIHEAVLRTSYVSHIMAYIAPLLMGGREAQSPIEGFGFENPDAAAKLTNRRITYFGEDILLEYDFKKSKHKPKGAICSQE